MPTLEALASQVDFLVVALPLSKSTEGLIGERELQALPRHAFVLNPARGPIIQEAALLRALEEKWIAGAALDVFDQEPLPADNPLRKAPNVLLSAHNCPFARETAEKVSCSPASASPEIFKSTRR